MFLIILLLLFLKAKTAIHKLFEEKYIYVPFELQRKFKIFERETNKKNYKKLCDCFLDYYHNTSKNCGVKILSTSQRIANNWYGSKLEKLFCKVKLICNFIFYITMSLCIWIICMLALSKILNIIIN